MSQLLSRRSLLRAASGLVPACLIHSHVGGLFAAPTRSPGHPTLGFSLYGMKSLSLAEAVRTCAESGYDDIEPALMADFPADPTTLSKPRRAELRKLLDSLGIRVPALMENINPLGSDEVHRKNLDRLARAAELGHDLSPQRMPVMETVIGGKPADWEKLREPLAERLREWGAAAKRHDLVIAVKPHMNNALHRPEDALWLIEAVGSPQIRLAYDYSHYEAQGLSLDATLTELMPETVFVHVKDGERKDGATRFVLPGEGNVDYVTYFRRLAELGYSGSVTVEVSSAIHKQPGYDPVAAAKQCYQTLATAWTKAGLPNRAK